MNFSGRKSLRWIVPAVVVLALAAFPLGGFGISWLLILFLFFVYLAMANMWNLLAGYTGLVSLGQPGFIGIAGYTLGVLSLMGISPILGIAVAGGVAAGFAFLIAFPTLRLRGLYFAIGTLMVSEALSIFFDSFKPPGSNSATWGGAGIVIKSAATVSLNELYYLGLIVGVGSMIVMRYVLRSKLGLGLTAIRDNEQAASSLGVNIFRTKMYSLMVSAFVTGAASAVFYIFQGTIEPISGFGINWTIIVMIATIIGGIGVEYGPVLGAFVAVLLQQYLAAFTGTYLLIEGIILIVIISLAPSGVVGTIQKAWAKRSAKRKELVKAATQAVPAKA
ncbi:MAG TPA: branched-chain amino acid ABC transporter permease [Nitrososphaerales archaeon]|nr:branched-chain amino acid ABC transporter permease [Nitrososphaerales archaeon]